MKHWLAPLLALALLCGGAMGTARHVAHSVENWCAALETTLSAAEAEDYGTVVIENGDRTVTFTEMPTGVLCANLYSAENMVICIYPVVKYYRADSDGRKPRECDRRVRLSL